MTDRSKISRRQLASSGALGGSAFLVGALFGRQALAQTPEGIVATPDGNFAPQTGIEREELIIGVQGLPATLDPAQELSNVGSRVNWTPYDTLIRRDFLNGDIHVPHIATSWTRPSDTVLDITLRDDVTFHNGDPFTADDVVFTFERLFNAADDSGLVEAATYFSTFDSIEQTGDYSVRITTKAPDPVLINRLASWGGWLVPRKHIESVGQEEFERTGMGTGPFRYTSFVPDNEIVLERYDGYWGDLPPVKKITFRVIPEVAARVTALINEEVDLITNVPPDQVETISSQDNVEVRDVVLSNIHVLVYNTNKPGLTDKRLRQALNLGIDRQLLIDSIWNGTARAKHGHQFPEYGPLFNADRPLTPYDPDRAKQLVEESDYNGEEIPYQTAAGYYTNAEQAAQAIVPMWQEIGINAVVEISESGASGDERWVGNCSNSSILADPEGCLVRAWGPGSNTQAQYWQAPDEFNELAEQARTTLDTQVRYDCYQRMLDIWEDEAPGTVLYDPAEFYGVNKSVNWTPYPLYNMDLRAYNLSFNEDE
ncbi:MAG TPA: ABC transporter substrate-binding protein [Thermomicrobiales bacterium]|nr:ABC transporter substrate-binding protein [Thermomicrobiales bacterium]